MSETPKDKELSTKPKSDTTKDEKVESIQQLTPLEQAQKAIISSLELINRGVINADYSLIARAHNPVSFIRKTITYDALLKILEKHAADLSERLTPYASKFPQDTSLTLDKDAMEDDGPEAATKPAQESEVEMSDAPTSSSSSETTTTTTSTEKAAKSANASVPEHVLPAELPPHAKYFLTYIVALFLYEHKLYAESLEVISQYLFDFSHHPHISYDFISSKVYMLYTNVQEKLNQLQTAEIRALLMKHHSHAHGGFSPFSLSVLAVCVLRSFILEKHFAQADQFVRHSTFPPLEKIEATVFSRFSYYSGLINAINLRYSQSLEDLTLALRTASDHITPFHIHIYRLFIIVHLLIGQIPDRSVFKIPEVVLNLSPYYLEITQAVRRGDVAHFNKIVQSPEAITEFTNDGLSSLILRLRQNVLRAGLKRILLVYSEIPLSKVGELLNIQEDDLHAVQLIVSKAIHDGVILGAINPVDNILVSLEHATSRGYHSDEPKSELMKRIQFNLTLHDQCKVNLRYPQVENQHTTSTNHALFMD